MPSLVWSAVHTSSTAACRDSYTPNYIGSMYRSGSRSKLGLMVFNCLHNQAGNALAPYPTHSVSWYLWLRAVKTGAHRRPAGTMWLRSARTLWNWLRVISSSTPHRSVLVAPHLVLVMNSSCNTRDQHVRPTRKWPGERRRLCDKPGTTACHRLWHVTFHGTPHQSFQSI